MSILVLGGAGYIGSCAALGLRRRGYDVIVADNMEKGHKSAVPQGVPLFVGDVRDFDFMSALFEENKIDAVMDFAAYSLVGESVAQPAQYYDNNVYGMLCLLRAMMLSGVDKIVFSSSAAVYGEPEDALVAEDAPKLPKSPYGETKLVIENMLKYFGAAYGIRSACLRYFNAAGAMGGLGEDHKPETHLIPIVLRAAMTESAVTLNGDDYDTPDGTCVRDYVHVEDLAEGHILALERLKEAPGAHVWNVGSGRGASILEILEAARRVTGARIKTKTGPRRPGDPSRLVADVSKIRGELGFAAKRADIEDIIESAWRFLRDKPNGYCG
ncbi:MAG: UDP-glucose 4-epimerase GalE [Clostridiales bacterium]|jgi:UDP-glucose 4-epimerase|nr:UDP-glucose 4-epimerase GalE [Clostridiales bacterium]